MAAAVSDPVASTCPLCGTAGADQVREGTDRLYQTTARRFRVVACRSCGLWRLAPMPAPDDLPRYYPDRYWFQADDSTPGRLEEVYRRFVLGDHVRFAARAARRAGSGARALDVGCGGGLFLRLLGESGCRVVGLDNALAAVRIAWRTNGVPAVCGSLESVPFRDGSFDTVTMFHVLEHLAEPAAYVRAVRRLLVPRGRLIVQVPNAGSLQSRLFRERWNGLDIPRHLLDFSTRTLTRLVTSCGFEVVRAKHFSLRDNPAGLATSLWTSLDPMARRLRISRETPRVRLLKDLVYLGLTAASLPFAAFEAALRRGSTIMLEARKTDERDDRDST